MPARSANAVLTTAIKLTADESCMNDIGDDAFAIIRNGNKMHGLNAWVRAPAQ